ncbi:MAG: hypothetical protein OHK0046_28820 [Anaerolineae bacterium]
MKMKRGDSVVPEMRERLSANRSGKLLPSQWLDIVMQPIITLLLLIVPVTVIGLPILPRLAVALFRGGWIVILLVIVVLVVSFMIRAARYARMPVQYGVFSTRSDSLPPVWMFWRAIRLYDEAGSMTRFSKRLCPRPLLLPDQQIIVYFLKEAEDNVLLSTAPADHPDVDLWQPDRYFEARLRRRQSL